MVAKIIVFCVDPEDADEMSHRVPFSHAVVTRDAG